MTSSTSSSGAASRLHSGKKSERAVAALRDAKTSAMVGHRQLLYKSFDLEFIRLTRLTNILAACDFTER